MNLDKILVFLTTLAIILFISLSTYFQNKILFPLSNNFVLCEQTFCYIGQANLLHYENTHS